MQKKRQPLFGVRRVIAAFGFLLWLLGFGVRRVIAAFGFLLWLLDFVLRTAQTKAISQRGLRKKRKSQSGDASPHSKKHF